MLDTFQEFLMSTNRFLRGLKTGLAVVGTLSIGTSLSIGYAIRAARAAKQVKRLAMRVNVILMHLERPCPSQCSYHALQKLPDEFVLDLDLEDIQLVEKSASNPLIQVSTSLRAVNPDMLPFAKRTQLHDGGLSVQNLGRVRKQLELKQVEALG